MTSYSAKIALPIHILGFAFLPWILRNPSWLVFTIVYFVITAQFGFELGFHRYLAHRSFRMSSKMKKFVLILGSLSGLGLPLFFVCMHRKHHKFSDTKDDPHSPSNGLLKSSLYSTYLGEAHQVNIFECRDVIRDSFVLWLDRNFYRVYWFAGLVLALIKLEFFIFGFVYGTLLSIHSFAVLNVVLVHRRPGHTKGYRNYQTNENSINRRIYSYLLGWYSWGGFLHNNHHAKPKLYRLDHLPHEFDLGRHVIELIREGPRDTLSKQNQSVWTEDQIPTI